jgi:hypothetical protein
MADERQWHEPLTLAAELEGLTYESFLLLVSGYGVLVRSCARCMLGVRRPTTDGQHSRGAGSTTAAAAHANSRGCM